MKNLNFYRINLIVGSVVILGLWFSHLYISPNGNDPLILRLLIVIPALFVVGLSYISDFFAKNIKYVFYTILYLITIWFTYLVYVNNGNFEYVTAEFIWIIVLSTYFESFLSLLFYSVFSLIIALTSITLLLDPMVNRYFYLLMLSSGLFVNFLSMFGKTKVYKALEEKSDELSKFKLIVQNAGEHIIITDKNGKIIFANDAVTRITGYPNAEIIGQYPSLWGKQMPSEFYSMLWNTIAVKKQRFTGEIRNKRKNGEIYIAEADITPILDSNGEVEFFVGIERDVTNERKARQLIDQKIIELNRMNSLMVGRELKMVALKKMIKKRKDNIDDNS